MIEEITFKNYKIFKKEQNLKLKPFTIILGKNNTGKSAVLKLVSLIEGALNSPAAPPISLINNEIACASKYSELVYGGFSRSLQLRLTSDKHNSLSVTIIIDVNQNQAIIESWNLNNELDLLLDENGNYYDSISENVYRCNFDGVLLSYFVEVGKEDVSIELPDQQGLTLTTDFIGYFRKPATKFYDFDGKKIFDRSGLDGSNMYDVLIADYLTTGQETYKKVKSWIQNNFGGWELEIDTDSEPYKIELRKDKLLINLFDTGEGIAQSLPIIIRSYVRESMPRIVMIEEPESHLHPYAHAQLAQLVYESHKDDNNKQYLIETHSQNFVLRLRTLVAEGLIKPSDIAIYFVEYNEAENESNLRFIEVLDNGSVNWWPDGVFNETSMETRALFNAQKQEK